MHKVCASLAAGAASSIVCCPSDLIVLHQQNKGQSMILTGKALYQDHGLRCFARGMVPTIGREALFAAGYQVLVPSTKAYFYEKSGSKIAAITCAGSAAGIFIAPLTQPFDVIKTGMQADPVASKFRGARDVLRNVLHREGWRGLFKGLRWRMAMTAISVSALNEAKQFLQNL